MRHSHVTSSSAAVDMLFEVLPDPDTVGEPEYRVLYTFVREIVDGCIDLSDGDTLGLVESSMEAIKEAADAILGHVNTVAEGMGSRKA